MNFTPAYVMYHAIFIYYGPMACYWNELFVLSVWNTLYRFRVMFPKRPTFEQISIIVLETKNIY